MIKIIIFITFITVILSQPVAAFAATLSLSPASGTFNKGCTFKLNVNVDTGGAQTDGTDAIIRFDPTRASATQITPGNIYSDYPGTNIDSTGKITISGLASVSSPFSGNGTLATIDFSVPSTAPTGATAITFEFDPNDPTKTTDSNIVERNTVKDVLTSVTNGNYTIGTGSCLGQGQTNPGSSSSTTNPGGATSTTSAQPKTIDELIGQPPGSIEMTYIIAITGTILTIIGILGLSLL